jgi:hypothetical protein
MINQDFEALIFHIRNQSEDTSNADEVTLSQNEIIKTTIIDALRFSIVLKSCSFIDEWDGFLGVRNENELKSRIELIKRTVTKARREINNWKDLRAFRNEIIAHNFRGKNNIVTIDMMGDYDCPQSIPELYYLVALIERLIRVLTACYSDISNEIVKNFGNIIARQKYPSSDADIKIFESKLQEIDNEISDNVFSIYRHDIDFELAKNIVKE